MKIKSGFILKEVENENEPKSAIVIAVGPASKVLKGYIKLNETACDLWHLIEKGLSVEEIVEEFVKTYDVTEEQATNDVKELISSLEKIGVIE